MNKLSKVKVVHYINQFFGGIGGEEKADHKPEVREGAVGPGLALSQAFGEDAEIVATVICGDGYYNENTSEALKEILEMIKKYSPDVLVAGPAFNAGRYGMACGGVCEAVEAELNIKTVTAMYEENPGVDSFKAKTYILPAGNSAASMRTVAPELAKFALKLGKGEKIGSASEEKFFVRGIRKNLFVDTRGSERAVNMLLDKINDRPFETEFAMPNFDNVEPGKAIKDITKAKIAIVTSGGIVPKGNPDRIEASSASKYGKYDISQFDDLTSETHETAHGGYDPVYANHDADLVIPVDVLRQFEKEGKIGSLHNYFYTTTGNGTSVKSSKGFAAEFTKELVADGVDAVILTST